MSLRFDGRVALVTGAGAGLGRAYAEWLAARGARVVVNNRVHPGVAPSADAVVEAICSAGGKATADYNPIETAAGGHAMVEAAYAHFGRLDIIVANAGGTTKKPILQTTLDEFRQNMDANFWGTAYPVLAALPRLIDANYGRIVLTTSAAGLYGQKQHAPYAAGKMAIVGFAKALAVETGKLNVRINMISPYARTTGSAHVLGEEMAKVMAPERVAPVVGWMAHESCKRTGVILSAGAGRIRRVGIVESRVAELPGDDVEAVWDQLSVLEGATESRNSARSSVALIPELAALQSS